MKRCAIYARVSTDKQDTANQLPELRRFAAASGWEVTREYLDTATGKHGDRDEFKEMLDDATRRKFDVLLVWALDRMTREGIFATFEYIHRLSKHGVAFVSYSEAHFRTDGPAGELLIAIAAWIATQERKRISDRTKAGLATARAKGRTLGRPKAKPDVAAIMALHAQGLGVARIAAKLGGYSRETVRLTILANREKAA